MDIKTLLAIRQVEFLYLFFPSCVILRLQIIWRIYMDYLIPKYVVEVVDKLEKAGYEAFIVGGSVRDLILGRSPNDFDITTNARPDEIIETFADYTSILTGVDFGTVTVVIDKNNIEITTHRIEEEYIDGRKPSKVHFTNDLEGDLSRRDFTINAMAFNGEFGLIDPFKGQKDLKDKLIKTVGNPRERFEEDHLRILRAIRFATQLNFTIEENTYKACKDMGKLLRSISVERIRDELFKILLSEKPSYGIKLMKDLEILEVILPELLPTIGFDQRNPHHSKDVFYHTLCVVDNTPSILSVRLAALFHDLGKPHTLSIDEEGVGHFYGHEKVSEDIARKRLNGLNCSNQLIKRVTSLVREHMTHHANYKDKGLKRLIRRVGKDNIFNLIDLQKADKMCSNPQADITLLNNREKQIKRILDSKEPYEKKQLAIDGSDILKLGYKEGKIIGEILDYLMEKVLEEPRLNNKDDLLRLIMMEFESDEEF